jgi:hypothetical protein
MPGVIIVKDTKANAQRTVEVLANLLDFVLTTPFPKSFMRESKFVISGEGCVMRGKDAVTKEIKSFHIIAGKTTIKEVRDYFSY